MPVLTFLMIIQVFQSTLPNGLRVVLEEDHSSPITTVRIFMDQGSIYEGFNTGRGLSHFCEHIVSGGSTEFRTEDEYREMEMRFNSRSNAYTSWEVTCYHQTVPSRYSDSVAMMLMEQVFSCSVDTFEVRREHGVIHHEILTSDTPDERIWRAAFVFFFGNHPISVPILGQEDAMLAITQEQLVSFYKTHYSPGNAVLVAVGDFETSQLYDFILHESEKFPGRAYEPSTTPSTPIYTHPRTDTFFDEIPNPLCYLMWTGCQETKPEYTALSVISEYLTGGQSSHLENILIDEKELAYEVWSYNMGLRRADGAFIISISSEDPKKLQEGIEIVQSELDKIARGGIDESRLTRTKNLLRYALLKDWTASMKSGLIGDGILTANDPLYFQKTLENISGVSAQDISKIALSMLSSEKRQTFFAFPSEYNQITGIYDTYTGAIPFVIYEGAGTPAIISQRDSSSLYVSLQVAFGGGSSIDPLGKEGAMEMLSEILGLRTKSFDLDGFKEKMDELGISRNSRCYDNYLVINYDFPLENFKKAMELIGEAISYPDFSDKSLSDIKKDMLYKLDQNNTNPNYRHNVFYTSKLYPENTYGRCQDEVSINSIEESDLRALFDKILVGKNVVVSLSGNVSPEDILASVESRFPHLLQGASLAMLPPSEIQSLMDDSLIYEFQQTLVTLAFPTVPWNHPDMPVLYVIDELMSGPNSRIHEALRGRQDLVYWGWGYQESFSDIGSFVFIAQTSLKNEDKVKNAFLEEINLVKSELLSGEELANLKNSIFASWDMTSQNPFSKLTRRSYLYLSGLEIDYYEDDFKSRIQEVTSEDVRNAALKYFDGGHWFVSRPDESSY
ncbi:insulinase family protein [candidate division WOR-3 bacterium]|nr:insulinase family protein [candidate division WOR-3 bacterium]